MNLSGLSEVAVEITAILAAVTAIGVFGRKLWLFWRDQVKPLVDKANTVLDIAEYELQHNGGGSIKDAAAQLPALRRSVDELVSAGVGRDHRMSEMETAIANLAEALPVVARSTPHPDDTAD